MIIIPLECDNCGAKLKVKSGAARISEVKCPKCGKPIPVPRDAPTITEAPDATPPTAPKPEPAAAAAETPAPAPVPAAPPPAELRKPIVVNPLGRPGISLVAVTCGSCKREMKVPTDLAGKKIRCKGCGTVLSVPAAEGKEGPAAMTPTASAPAVTPAEPVAPDAELRTRLAAAEARLSGAERRTQEAEKALHDLAGQKAVENVNANRRITELEAQLAALHGVREHAIQDLKAEIEAAEKRIAELKRRVASLSGV